MWELRLTGNIGFPITQGILPAIFGYFICATPFLEIVGNPISHLTRNSTFRLIVLTCYAGYGISYLKLWVMGMSIKYSKTAWYQHQGEMEIQYSVKDVIAL